MKENKYRGRRGQTWYYGGTAQDQGGSAVIITSRRSCGDHFYFHIEPVDNETVGQYIGLHDKNNTEIYKGDIIKYNNDIYEVCYDERYCIFVLKAGENCIEFADWKQRFYEVIGNIYDKATTAEGGIQ